MTNGNLKVHMVKTDLYIPSHPYPTTLSKNLAFISVLSNFIHFLVNVPAYLIYTLNYSLAPYHVTSLYIYCLFPTKM